MRKYLGAICGLMLAAGLVPAKAQDKSKLDDRLASSATVIREIESTPDHAVPDSILSRAHCVIVIPSVKKAAFLVGGQYGQGVGTCRTGHGWSAPVFIRLTGGSFGFQIGGQATDLVLLGMNDKSLQDLLHSKFKLGADAAAAAGPVGRNAQAGTDLYLNAEFLTYSRSKGLFAGLDLSGDVMDLNGDEFKSEYGPGVRVDDVLHGTTPVPANAQQFVHTVARYFVSARQ